MTTATAGADEEIELNFDMEDDDEDYVPESLRGFLDDIESTLEATTKDILGDRPRAEAGSGSVDESSAMIDSTIANSHSGDSPNGLTIAANDRATNRHAEAEATTLDGEGCDEDEEMISEPPTPRQDAVLLQFESAAQAEGKNAHTYYDQNTRNYVQITIKDDSHNGARIIDPSLQDDTSATNGDANFDIGVNATVDQSDLWSPGPADYPTNPAAHLTASQAKELALEGATPSVNNKVPEPVLENGDYESSLFSPVVDQNAHEQANATFMAHTSQPAVSLDEEEVRPANVNLQMDMDQEANDSHPQDIEMSLSKVSTTPLPSSSRMAKPSISSVDAVKATRSKPSNSTPKSNDLQSKRGTGGGGGMFGGLRNKAKIAPIDTSSPSELPAPPSPQKKSSPSTSFLERMTRGTASSKARTKLTNPEEEQGALQPEEMQREEELEKQQQEQKWRDDMGMQQRLAEEQKRLQEIEKKRLAEEQTRRAEVEKQQRLDEERKRREEQRRQEDERKRREKIERQQRLDEERKRREEIEKKRIAEEKKRREEQLEKERIAKLEKIRLAKLAADEERLQKDIERQRKGQEARELNIRREQQDLESGLKVMEIENQELEEQNRNPEEEKVRQKREAMKQRLEKHDDMLQRQGQEQDISEQMQSMSISQTNTKNATGGVASGVPVPADASGCQSFMEAVQQWGMDVVPPEPALELPCPPSMTEDDIPVLPIVPHYEESAREAEPLNFHPANKRRPESKLRRPAKVLEPSSDSVPMVVTTGAKIRRTISRSSSRSSLASELTAPQFQVESKQKRATRTGRAPVAAANATSAAPSKGGVFPRLLRGTASSNAKHGSVQVVKVKERRTSPKEHLCKSSPTASTRIRMKPPQVDPPHSAAGRVPRPLLQLTASHAAKTLAECAPSLSSGVRDLVRQRMFQTKKQKTEPDAASKLNRARRKSVADTLEEARLRRAKVEREKLDRIERSRKEREDRLALIEESKRAQRVEPKPQLPKPSKFKPTVPVLPNFATDSRLGKKEPAGKSVSSKSSDSAPMPSRPPAKPALTVPVGPKLATSARNGPKSPVKPSGAVQTKESWESALRSSSAGSTSSRTPTLTIPQTPKFHSSNRRELPKSTAEKEKEEMEYFQSHPFRALPVRMNEVSSEPNQAKKKRKKRLTMCEPFHFRTGERVSKSHDDDENNEQRQSETQREFRARPMPDFSKTQSIPLSGKAPDPDKRQLTQPQPFQFLSDKRAKADHSARKEDPPQNEQPAHFKARPMPDFSRAPLTQYDSGGRSRHRQKEETSEANTQFKARPMPDFSSQASVLANSQVHSNKPLTTPTPFKFHTEERAKISAEKAHEEESQNEFHARSAPNFSSPVTPRGRSRIRSPPNHLHSKDMPEEVLVRQFRARPAPNFPAPSISVKGRDPSKLRSPDTVRPPVITNEELHASPQFKARKIPNFFRQRARDPQSHFDDPYGRPPPKTSSPRHPIRDLRTGAANLAQSPDPAGRHSASGFSRAHVKRRLNQVISQSPAGRAHIEERIHAASGVPATIMLPTPRKRPPNNAVPTVNIDAFEEQPGDVYAFREPVLTPRSTPPVQKTREERLRERAMMMQRAAAANQDTDDSISGPVESSEDILSRELAAATDQWIAAQEVAPQDAFKTDPGRAARQVADARRQDELRRAREAAHQIQMSRQRDTLQMAYQLERAADDELSFGTRDRVAPSGNSYSQYTISSHHSASVFHFYKPEEPS